MSGPDRIAAGPEAVDAAQGRTEEAFAVVVARGGSERVPGKNRRLLGGRPLFQWSLEAALESGAFETVWFSSDDAEMLEIAAGMPGVIAERRPDDLAGPRVNGITLMRHVIARVRERRPRVRQFCMLQPTSPFRSGAVIRRAMALLNGSEGWEMVVGVREYAIPIHFALSRENGLHPMNDGFLTRLCHTDQAPVCYHPAGGLYCGSIAAFEREGHFYGPASYGLELDALGALDINTEDDFRIAELIAAGGTP